jgi:hypothetical protein
MPVLENIASTTASTADTDDKFIISVDGSVKTISTSELKKLMSLSEEVEVAATTYTLLATDQTKVVRATHADAKTFTIPATSGFLIGCPIIIRNASATDITLVADTGVTANASTLTVEQNTGFVLIPRATDNWDVYAGGAGGSAGPTQLSTPTLTMSSASSTTMDFSYTNVANESSYYVQIAEDAGFTVNVQTATPAADDTAHQFTGLTASTTYYGRVKAVGDGVTYSDSAYGTDNEATPAASYDADAQAYFTRMDAVGSPLSSTFKNAYDAFVVSAKGGANSYYTELTQLYIHAGHGELAKAAMNSIANNKTKTFVGSPTISSADGVTYTGGDTPTQYAQTGITPSTDLSENDFMCGFWTKTNIAAFTSDTQYAMGAYGSGETNALDIRGGGSGTDSRIHLHNAIDVAKPATGVGLWMIGRSTEIAWTAWYVNTTQVYQSVVTSGTQPAVEIYEGCRNVSGSGAVHGSPMNQLLTFYSTGMSVAQYTQFYNNLSTFLTAIGAI